jgi:GNAT superfamily N-acetyltransferase
MRFLLDATDVAAAKAVDQGLGDFNDAEPALADVHPLVVFAHDEAGAVAGGAVGRTWGTNAELQQLWVREDQRRSGLGAELMRRFEAQALARGVTLVYLDTFSFQAPVFYGKLGYTSVVLIEGFTSGISKHHMHKRLDGART